MYQSDKHSVISLQPVVNTVQTLQIMNKQRVTSKLLGISSKKRVNNKKIDETLNIEALLMKFQKRNIYP